MFGSKELGAGGGTAEQGLPRELLLLFLLAGSMSRDGVQALTTNRKIMDLLERRDLTAVRRSGSRETQKNEAPDERELRSKQEQMCTKNRTTRKR